MSQTKLLIYSGGMDSTALLYRERENIALCVTFDYGSKHNRREVEYARCHTETLGIEHLEIRLDPIADHFRSDLLESGGDVPHGHYEDASMKRTVVPFRNGIMLSVAVGLAESRGLTSVLIANHFGDHAIYPDCRDVFVHAFARAASAGTYENIEIEAPYTFWSKREIAEDAHEHGHPIAQSWSCYEGRERHCGRCGTCVERKEALRGFDPTDYRA